jgi:hypothetical protein
MVWFKVLIVRMIAVNCWRFLPWLAALGRGPSRPKDSVSHQRADANPLNLRAVQSVRIHGIAVWQRPCIVRTWYTLGPGRLRQRRSTHRTAMTQAFYDAARHRTRLTRSIEKSLLSSRPLSSRRSVFAPTLSPARLLALTYQTSISGPQPRLVITAVT